MQDEKRIQLKVDHAHDNISELLGMIIKVLRVQDLLLYLYKHIPDG